MVSITIKELPQGMDAKTKEPYFFHMDFGLIGINRYWLSYHFPWSRFPFLLPYERYP